MTKIRKNQTNLPDSMKDWPSEFKQDQSANLEMYYKFVRICPNCKQKYGSDIKKEVDKLCPKCNPYSRNNFGRYND